MQDYIIWRLRNDLHNWMQFCDIFWTFAADTGINLLRISKIFFMIIIEFLVEKIAYSKSHEAHEYRPIIG